MKFINGMILTLLTSLMAGCGGGSNTNSNGTGGTLLSADETVATIPASIAGQYTFTFSESLAGSGIADGTTTVFNIGSDGTLVIDGVKTLTQPVLYKGNASEAIWTDAASNLKYAASSVVDGETLREINISNNTYYDDTANFKFYGQYNDPAANTGTCLTQFGKLTVTPDANVTSEETNNLTEFCAKETPTLLSDDSSSFSLSVSGIDSSMSIRDLYYISGGYTDIKITLGYYVWKLEGAGDMNSQPGMALDKTAKTVTFTNAVLVPKKTTYVVDGTSTTYESAGNLTLNGTLSY